MKAPLWAGVLPFPPSANAHWLNAVRKTKAGRHFTARRLSPQAVAFRAEVAAVVRKGHRAPSRLEGRLSLVVLAQPPDLRRRDLDNLCKELGDALVLAGVLRDDVQFDDVRIVRGNVVEGGRVHVRIDRFDPRATENLARAFGVAENGLFATPTGTLGAFDEAEGRN